MNPESDDLKRASHAGLFDDVLLSVNLGAGLQTAGLIFVLLSASSIKNVDDAGYLALRSVYRVSDFLQLYSTNPVSTFAVRRSLPGRAEQWAVEITLFLTWCALVGVILLGLQLFNRVRFNRKALDGLKLPILLFASPAVFLLVSWWTRDWRTWGRLDAIRNLDANNLTLLLFIAELLCLGAMLLRPSRRTATSWVLAVIAVHWTFWGIVIWKASQMWLTPIYAGDWLLIVLPATTLMWVWRAEPWAGILAGVIYRHRRSLYALGAGAILLGVALWHPARKVVLSHPRNWKTLTVEVSRGPASDRVPYTR